MTPRATFLNLPRFFRNVKDAIVSDPLKIAFHIANVLMVLIPGLCTLPVLNLLGFGAKRTISCDAVWVIAFLIWLKVLLKARSACAAMLTMALEMACPHSLLIYPSPTSGMLICDVVNKRYL
jgi:hypothetical protein